MDTVAPPPDDGMIENHTFDEIGIGDSAGLSHRLTEQDIDLFALVSGDVNPAMPSTLDAAALCKMADRGQIIGGIVDGPLAFDNAVSPEAARQKGIALPVAGQADILVVPGLEAGNMLAKQLSFLAGADAAGVVVGARVPIVLTSRADSERTRIASCAVAVLIARGRRAATARAA
jgi:phosphotransacetylase